MKIRLFFVMLTLLAATHAAGAEATQYPLTVADDTGVRVTLPHRPTRIVSLTLATDEMLLSFVEPGRLLAVTTFAVDGAVSNVAAQAAAVPHKLGVNVETVISLAPDLVLVANWTDPGPVRQLRDAGLSVYLMASGSSVVSIKEKIARLALMTGDPSAGQTLIAGMDAKLASVAARVAKIPQKERPRIIDYGSWGGAQGRGSSWDEIVRRAGLVNGVADFLSDEWGQVPLSRETILQIDPDIMILPAWVYGNDRGASRFHDQVVNDPALRGLTAVRTGRIYPMPERLKGTTSQYIADSVEWLARTAYPALFR